MAWSQAQSPAAAEGTHLVLYDGVCGLCNRLVQFVLKHDRRAIFALASLQSGVGREMVERFGGNPDELTTFYIVANHRASHARLFSRSGAALFLARELGWPWKAATVLRVLPSVLLDRAYSIVANHRYRVFGRYDQCVLPQPEFRRRFLDV